MIKKLFVVFGSILLSAGLAGLSLFIIKVGIDSLAISSKEFLYNISIVICVLYFFIQIKIFYDLWR